MAGPVTNWGRDLVHFQSCPPQPPYMWWPMLTPDFCQLVASLDSWDIPDADAQDLPLQAGKRFSPGGAFGFGDPRHRCQLGWQGFYVCLHDGWDKAAVWRCEGLESLFCSAWGCETTGEVYWKPSSSWNWIIVYKNYTFPQKCSGNNPGICGTTPTCIPLNITITTRGRTKALSTCLWGRTWGLKWCFPDRLTKRDLRTTFKIQLKVKGLLAHPVGPNKVLAEQSAPAPLPPRRPPLPPTFTTPSKVSLAPLEAPTATTFPQTGQRLLNLVQGALSVIKTSLDLIKSCWLCLASGPPYYEGTAVLGGFNSTTTHEACMWGQHHKITLTQVSGFGTCIGTRPQNHQHLCNETLKSHKTSDTRYLFPGLHKWWACNTGLIPCVSTAIFDNSKDYCVLVQLVLRVLYLLASTLKNIYDKHVTRFHRKPVTLTLAVILGLGVATWVGTDTTALI